MAGLICVGMMFREGIEMLQHWIHEAYFWILLWLVVAIVLLVAANALTPQTLIAVFGL
jgi:hypothetical protein